jgi:hypothetical protein
MSKIPILTYNRMGNGFMRLEPLISHTGILMTFFLSIILDLQNFFHWYILQSWKLKRPPIQLRPHHFWTYTSSGQLSTKIYDKRDDFNFSLYIFTIWKCIAYIFFCRDGIYFDKILVSEYKLFKRSNKANMFIVLAQ